MNEVNWYEKNKKFATPVTPQKPGWNNPWGAAQRKYREWTGKTPSFEKELQKDQKSQSANKQNFYNDFTKLAQLYYGNAIKSIDKELNNIQNLNIANTQFNNDVFTKYPKFGEYIEKIVNQLELTKDWFTQRLYYLTKKQTKISNIINKKFIISQQTYTKDVTKNIYDYYKKLYQEINAKTITENFAKEVASAVQKYNLGNDNEVINYIRELGIQMPQTEPAEAPAEAPAEQTAEAPAEQTAEPNNKSDEEIISEQISTFSPAEINLFKSIYKRFDKNSNERKLMLKLMKTVNPNFRFIQQKKEIAAKNTNKRVISNKIPKSWF